MQSSVSLTPGLFPPPVFDRLRCADMEGEEIWSCAVMSDRQRVDIKGAVSDKDFSKPRPRAGGQEHLQGSMITICHS